MAPKNTNIWHGLDHLDCIAAQIKQGHYTQPNYKNVELAAEILAAKVKPKDTAINPNFGKKFVATSAINFDDLMISLDEVIESIKRK